MSKTDYSTDKYPFPPDEIDPEVKKQSAYCIAYAKAAYGDNYRTTGGYRGRDMYMLRLYAQGRQPIEKYLDLLCPKDKHGKRKTFVDISSDVISVIPKFRSIVIGKFLQMDHEIEANAVDENSGLEKRNKRYKLWAKSQIQKRLQPFQDLLQVGVPPEQAQEIIPQSIEELDMLESTGSFKLKWEIGIEKLIKDSFNISNWNDIKYRAYEDIFDFAMLATRDYTDIATGKAMCRYVDIDRLVVRYSNHKKFDNIDYAGEILSLTPNEIKTAASNELSEEVINQVIKENMDSSKYDNYTDGVNSFYEKYGNQGIRVMDITWKTIDTVKQEKRVDSRGEAHYNKVKYNHKKKRNREILIGKKQMVYRAKWIVGTDYVYDYGIEEDVLRPTKKTVKLPFNIYKISDKSMLEMIIPNEDNLNLAWLKFQNTLAKAAPPGMAVDISSLKNVTNGKNKLTPLEVLQIRRETGDLLFSATTSHNQVLNPNAGRPVYELPGGGGAMLEEQMSIIRFNIDMIRQLTGINELMDASAPAPNTLVGTAELAAQGTNNTLYILYNAYKTVKEETANNLCYRIQNIIRYQDYMPYESVIGESLVNIFKAGSPIASSTIGIKLTLKPQQAEKRSLLDKANFAFQQGILKYSDIMFLENEIENGSIKYARMYIMYKEGQYMEQEAAKNALNVQQQSQAIMEQQENALEGRLTEQDNLSKNNREETSIKGQADALEYRAKGEIKQEEEDNKSQNKIKENLLK